MLERVLRRNSALAAGESFWSEWAVCLYQLAVALFSITRYADDDIVQPLKIHLGAHVPVTCKARRALGNRMKRVVGSPPPPAPPPLECPSRMPPRNAQDAPCSVMPRPAPSILRTHQVIRGVAGTLGQGTCEEMLIFSGPRVACCMLHAACCMRMPLSLAPPVNDHAPTATDRKRKRRRAVAIKIPEVP